ncbi:MAG: tRNA dihydrouridine synthase DusB [Desulfosalsimonadaceae bacterium]
MDQSTDMTRKCQIGGIRLENPTVLAPMAGITDVPFRRMARENGCALVCSEMISANGMIYGQEKTLAYLTVTESEKPVSIQIFGKDPAIMADAAAMAAGAGADIVDINFGCSVRKILKNGYGAALMKDLSAAKAIFDAVRNAIAIPLTIKMRSGWDASGEDAVALARISEDCGVDAVAVHPRTVGQLFRGNADWSVIAAVKKAVAIPVIGNGDVVSAGDAVDMIGQTGCDAVMIGRAAVSNPWIFQQTAAILENRPVPEVRVEDRLHVLLRYIDDAVNTYGEARAAKKMRSRLGWLVKGMPHAARFREEIKRIETRSQAKTLVIDYFEKAKPETEEKAGMKKVG